MAPPESVPLTAEWVQDTKGEEWPERMPAELRVMYEADKLFIDGLRGGQYLTLDFIDLMDAMVRSDRAGRSPRAATSPPA